MSQEQKGIKPFVYARSFSFPNLIDAILDSRVVHIKVHIGTLGQDGKTVRIGKTSIIADCASAKPGDRVVTHEV